MKILESQKKIFVGVSGGVDSSVALAMLQEQGHTVVGVFIRTWQPDWIECTWQQERTEAMRVCAHLGVPFVELNLEKEYKEGVADYMIREYRAGRTPNPDVMCNREVKFGGFLRWAKAHGADYVATGHYVGSTCDEKGLVHMLRGKDVTKDQSYFLWTLTQEQLIDIIFPLGDLEKSQVRKLAMQYKLPTATKKDSQGICFIGEIDMKEFLSHYIEQKPGDVLDTNGKIIGSHNGALFYTISERHGFSIHPQYKGTNDSPYYVIAKGVSSNTITVSQNPKIDTVISSSISLIDIIDIQGIFKKGLILQAQIRYRGDIKKITVTKFDVAAKTMTIIFENHDYSIASGQSVVFYKEKECLGGGVVI